MDYHSLDALRRTHPAWGLLLARNAPLIASLVGGRKSKTRDVVDASVALLARRHAATGVTSDPDDTRKIDSKLVTVAR